MAFWRPFNLIVGKQVFDLATYILIHFAILVNRGWACFCYKTNRYFLYRQNPYGIGAVTGGSGLVGIESFRWGGFGFAVNDTVCTFLD